MTVNLRPLYPPSKIGIIGGGQLGKMLTQVAKRMGYHVTILDPDPISPGGKIADKQITASFNDYKALEQLASITDVLTYEFEHINAEILVDLKNKGYRVFPSGDTLKLIQNKYDQKSFLESKALPVPSFKKICNIEDIVWAGTEFGYPLVLKTCKGGYDGKGNAVIKSQDEIPTALEILGGFTKTLMAEQFIDFKCELSVLAVRGYDGKMVFYPMVQNIHHNSILHLTYAPALIDKEIALEAQTIASKVMEHFDDVGIFCIELFLSQNDQLYINEIAPRTHNSGHYTIEASITSQFEQHLRAITGLPLGSAKLISPSAMVNILGSKGVDGCFSVEGLDNFLDKEGVYFHLYGKEHTRHLRKIGHITALGQDVQEAQSKALKALDNIKIVSREG